MQESKKYWRGLEELENTPEFAKAAHNEFAEFLPVKETFGTDATEAEVAPRRDFLKLLGFGLAAATLASCEAPVRKAIPYLNKPEDVDPGIANWYASTYFQGGDYNSVLVKTREGRPIKLEGNPQSPITKGGLSAKAQASVLSLYDTNRLTSPYAKGKPATWEQVDREIMDRLGKVNGKVVLVSSTIISPTTKKAIGEFAGKYGNFEHIVYDANSASGLVKANGGVVPGYDFSKASVIVSVGADFLGTWLMPVAYAKQYIKNRKITKENPVMSRHFQFESNLSLTGSNADVRVQIRPSQESMVVAALHSKIVGGSVSSPIFDDKRLDKAVEELMAARGRALVVSGSNDQNIQSMVRAINAALGAEGSTIDGNPVYIRQGDDAQMLRFVRDMNQGTVGAVIFYGANPVYDYPLTDEVKEGLGKVGLKISLAETMDETAALVDYVCPDNNYLESWNDFEPKKGHVSFAQPAISPLFKTRQAQETLLTWSGNKTDYYTYLKNNWQSIAGGDSGWDKAIHDGIMENAGTSGQAIAVTSPVSGDPFVKALGKDGGSGIELAIYEKVGIGTGGIEANNPWLQELPDPVTKATWDNYVTIPISMAKDKKIEQGEHVKITARNGKSIVLPALVQPGQAPNTVGIAIGYGRTKSGKVATNVGGNVYPLAMVTANGIMYNGNVTLEKEAGSTPIAQTQTHNTIMGRIVVQESDLNKYKKDPKSVTERVMIATPEGAKRPAMVSLWQDYEYKDHHWGMVIDLNSCIGCGSCVVGCNVENNVAIVGKQEVINRREMHWMRIDRYYSSDATREDGFTEMENPSENPTVIFQPMLCQHCNHAPCETVCPVLATTHSSEGINQMTYNRCVGTRYCANNCPYKVRRFNWFSYPDDERFTDVNYTQNTDLGRMVLNPDVTVRARGVMEKCSFCIQRVQYGKLEAKKEKRRPVDGEIVTACAQSCPTNAIVFGDMKDPNSEVRKIMERENGERAFTVLEEINTQPNITYLTKIRNLA